MSREEIDIIAGELEAIRDALEGIRCDTDRETGNLLQVPTLALTAVIDKLHE